MKKKTLSQMSVGAKLMGFYIVFGLIPLMIAYLYTFHVLRRVLVEDGYRYIRQEAERLAGQMDMWVNRYSIMIDNIYMDYYTNAYLMTDYSDVGYENMYPYINKFLMKLSLLCPEKPDIGFYSYNRTLPEDRNYFHGMEQLKEGWFDKAVEAGGFTVLAGVEMLQKYGVEKPYLCFVKMMNYYKNGSAQNVLWVGVDIEAVLDGLWAGGDPDGAFMIGEGGIILLSPNLGDVGGRAEEILPEDIAERLDGEGVPGEEELLESGQYYLVIRECALGIRILVMEEKAVMMGQAERMERMLILLLAGTSVVALCSVFLFSKGFGSRINRIVYATELLQSGNFTYFIREKRKDEIGRIGDAVDALTVRMDRLIQENYEKQLKLKDSEINLLSEQINPHFLYNALSTISSLSMMEGDRLTSRCVKALGEFYRVSLNDGKGILSVQEELELLKSYLVIQKFRFDDSIEISYDVEPGTLSGRCLKLLLQPVVENSIKYGIWDNNGGELHIKIHISHEGEELLFAVEDDGVGMEPEVLYKVREDLSRRTGGYGLKNIDMRIKLQYGDEYGLALESERGKGTRVTIRIPWEE